MIKWVIFDVMGVIFTEGDNVTHLLIPYLLQINPSFQPESVRLRDNYVLASSGKRSSAEFWTKIGFDDYYPAIEREFLANCYTLDPEFRRVAKQLHAEYKLGILSNDLADWSQQLRARFSLDNLFDTIVISGEVGCRKPDQQIFEILLDRVSVTSEECAFVDDKIVNLATAAELGFITIYFARDDQYYMSGQDFMPNATIYQLRELPHMIRQFM